MPIYEYKCRVCEEYFDVEQSFSDDTLTTIDGCAVDESGQHQVKKVFAAPAISFKGGGFYRNDARPSGGESKSSSSTSTSDDSSSSSDSSTSSDSASTSDSSSTSNSSSSSSPSSDGGSSGSKSSSSGDKTSKTSASKD